MRIISFIFLICLSFSISVSAQTEASQTFFRQGTQAANASDYQKALEFYKKSLLFSEAENNAKTNSFLIQIHYNIGVCYYQLNELSTAVKEFITAIDLSDRHYQKAFYALGMAETELKNFANAKAAFLESIKLNEHNGEVWFDLAAVFVQEKDYKNLQKAFAKAIKYNSVSKSASYNNIGVIFALTNDFQSAENQFKLALLESNGKLIEAENNLQLCRLRLQWQDAKLLAKLVFSIKTIGICKTKNQEKKWINNQMLLQF